MESKRANMTEEEELAMFPQGSEQWTEMEWSIWYDEVMYYRYITMELDITEIEA
jgi:hypothetical protein